MFNEMVNQKKVLKTLSVKSYKNTLNKPQNRALSILLLIP